MKKVTTFLLLTLTLLFTGCATQKDIVSNVGEKEANVILVLLESKGIPATKNLASAGAMGGADTTPKYSIMVPEKYAVEAIAYLNQNGFPREKGTNLLGLFAKQGLMTSDKEETIRYQAGLAQQLTNTILMIDGVIDASVQLSFPSDETVTEQQNQKITAAVYVKHQGVIDDPNIHLENKIKRLISGSVTGLDINDVTVVSDRSRFTDITLSPTGEMLGGRPGEYVSILSMVVSKDSAPLLRLFLGGLLILLILCLIVLGWLIWKFYPTLKKKGALKELFSPIPWVTSKKNKASSDEGPSI